MRVCSEIVDFMGDYFVYGFLIALPSIKLIMSSFNILPFLPEPCTWDKLTLFDYANILTAGDAKISSL